MTETSTPSPAPENDDITPASSSSPWVMIISMLLLISGLILSSAMLMHHAMGGKKDTAKRFTFDFTKLMEKGKDFSAKAQTPNKQVTTENEPPAATDSKPVDSTFKKFFSRGGDRAVRWPKLKLTGFGTPSGSDTGFAIINGKHIYVGGTVNDATLVGILEYGVLLEYKGEKKTFIVEVTR